MPNEQTSVPLYAASEILTAANINISAGTGVPVFATTVTRDAAFGGANEKVLAEGQLCYLSSTNVVQYYDGAAWASVGQAGGKVLQVVGATFATLTTTTSTSYVTTGLTATITPSLASSKVLILTSQAVDGNATDESCFTIFRGTVAGTNLGAANGMGGIFPSTFQTNSLIFLDSPSTSSAQAYTVGMKNLSGAGTTRAQSSNRTATITLLEIGA